MLQQVFPGEYLSHVRLVLGESKKEKNTELGTPAAVCGRAEDRQEVTGNRSGCEDAAGPPDPGGEEMPGRDRLTNLRKGH